VVPSRAGTDPVPLPSGPLTPEVLVAAALDHLAGLPAPPPGTPGDTSGLGERSVWCALLGFGCPRRR